MNAVNILLVALLGVFFFRWGSGYGKESGNERIEAFECHASLLAQVAHAILTGEYEEQHLRWILTSSVINNAPLTKKEREVMAKNEETLIALAKKVKELGSLPLNLIDYLDPDKDKRS